VEGPVTALRFGQYGREDSTLIIVHGKAGSMTIKILKRLADIEHKGDNKDECTDFTFAYSLGTF
jgi:hypothetical protein